jgi:hypothetical protein
VSFDGRLEALITIPTGGATVAITRAGVGPVDATVAAGTYYFTAAGGVSSIITALQTAMNAVSTGWTVTHSLTGSSATGRVTINTTGNPWSLTWTSTTLRDLLGFTGNIAGVSAAQTGTNQARGLWFPRAPLMLDGDPGMAPKESDLRTMQSPTGDVIGIVGNVRRVHKRLRWSHVPRDRYREVSASLDYASWEAFVDDTQIGEGLSFFAPAGKVQIYDHNGAQVGADASVSGWYMKGVRAVDSRMAVENFTGYFGVEIPEITTSG